MRDSKLAERLSSLPDHERLDLLKFLRSSMPRAASGDSATRSLLATLALRAQMTPAKNN